MRGKPSKKWSRLTPLKVDMPPDLWPEVLVWLPVKTLVRFRCVCKSWRSFIDDPDFVSMHLTLCNNNDDPQKPQIVSLAYDQKPDDDYGGYTDTDYELWTHCMASLRDSGVKIVKFFRSDDPQVIVESYLNGLMLLSVRNSISRRKYYNQLMLFNPSIRKYLTLPRCPANLREIEIYLLGMDPLSSNATAYKVVVLDRHKSRAVIYDLSTGSWRTKTIENAETLSNWICYRHVFWKGAVHYCISNFEDHSLLVSFDFRSETLSYKDLPCASVDPTGICPFLLGESLALCDAKEYEFCIWVMEKFDECQPLWTKRYTVAFEIYSIHDIFYVDKKDMFFVDTIEGVHSFHLQNNKVKKLRKLSRPTKSMDTYVESLVLLSSGLDSGGPTFSMPFPFPRGRRT